jgi:hypothetical protein
MITVKKDSKNQVIEIKSGALTNEILESTRETRSTASGVNFSFENKPKVGKIRANSDSKLDKNNSNPVAKITSVAQPVQLPPVQAVQSQALPVSSTKCKALVPFTLQG